MIERKLICRQLINNRFQIKNLSSAYPRTGLFHPRLSFQQPFLYSRAFASSRWANEQQKTDKEKNDGSQAEARGVPDPGTNVHGYDPLIPRKPLSRITVGKSYDPQAANRQNLIGFINWKAALAFLTCGALITWFFKKEKKRVDLERVAEANRGIGKPLVGGPFNLIDQNGKPYSDKDLLGKFSLVYFGFSMCPDICPDELEKMAKIIDNVNKDSTQLLPIFITCDPARDSPEVLKEYLEEFHPDIIGLTGSYDDIKSTCKAYRVYFSTPPNMKPGQDYLVDHSIFFYLMDPEGKFVDALGRQYDVETAIERIKDHMSDWIPSEKREKAKEKGIFSWFP